MLWYGGPPAALSAGARPRSWADRNLIDVRLPVQWVIRSEPGVDEDFRGYAGKMASGCCASVGDDITVLPSGESSRVTAISNHETAMEEAYRRSAVGDRPAGRRHRYLARGPDLPAAQSSVGQPGHRGRGVLDVGGGQPPERALPGQAHDQDGARGAGGGRSPDRCRHAAPRRGLRAARAQRDRTGAAAHGGAADLRPLRPEPAHRRFHPDRRGDQRDRCRRHDPRGRGGTVGGRQRRAPAQRQRRLGAEPSRSRGALEARGTDRGHGLADRAARRRQEHDRWGAGGGARPLRSPCDAARRRQPALRPQREPGIRPPRTGPRTSGARPMPRVCSPRPGRSRSSVWSAPTGRAVSSRGRSTRARASTSSRCSSTPRWTSASAATPRASTPRRGPES